MEKISNLLISTGAAFAGVSAFFKFCTYTVDAGERAIIFDRIFGGLKEKIISEGMHFYVPIL